MTLQYTPNSQTEYTVWHNVSHRVGVVRKHGTRWLAISYNRNLGSFASMSEAGERLVEEENK